VVVPFVEVLRSEETSGMITGLALSSLTKFVDADLFQRVRRRPSLPSLFSRSHRRRRA
jgi:hypothetical protein